MRVIIELQHLCALPSGALHLVRAKSFNAVQCKGKPYSAKLDHSSGQL
jgi:hypothetical protein